MKLTTLELERMARRGAEDGYDTTWHAQMTESPRMRSTMGRIRDETLATLFLEDEKAYQKSLAKWGKENE